MGGEGEGGLNPLPKWFVAVLHCWSSLKDYLVHIVAIAKKDRGGRRNVDEGPFEGCGQI